MKGCFNCPICMSPEPHEHQMLGRWIGVDFDGTLAVNVENRASPYDVGPPVPSMVARVRGWRSLGFDVRLLTARMCQYSATTGWQRDLDKMRGILAVWCTEHVGEVLPVTNSKDGLMEVLWDDRAVGVTKNTGQPVRGYSA